MYLSLIQLLPQPEEVIFHLSRRQLFPVAGLLDAVCYYLGPGLERVHRLPVAEGLGDAGLGQVPVQAVHGVADYEPVAEQCGRVGLSECGVCGGCKVEKVVVQVFF